MSRGLPPQVVAGPSRSADACLQRVSRCRRPRWRALTCGISAPSIATAHSRGGAKSPHGAPSQRSSTPCTGVLVTETAAPRSRRGLREMPRLPASTRRTRSPVQLSACEHHDMEPLATPAPAVAERRGVGACTRPGHVLGHAQTAARPGVQHSSDRRERRSEAVLAATRGGQRARIGPESAPQSPPHWLPQPTRFALELAVHQVQHAPEMLNPPAHYARPFDYQDDVHSPRCLTTSMLFLSVFELIGLLLFLRLYLLARRRRGARPALRVRSVLNSKDLRGWPCVYKGKLTAPPHAHPSRCA